MANPITNLFNSWRINRDLKYAQRIMQNIDTIALTGISRKSRTTKDAVSLSPKSGVMGKLKKVFAPNRNVFATGIYRNIYNMTDMYTSYNGENLVKYAADKYTEAVVRNGGYVDSKNTDIVKYLNKRLMEFEVVSGTTTSEFIRDSILSIILYGNTLTIKHRQASASSGKPYIRWDGKTREPIASLYVEDMRKILFGTGPASRMRYVRLDQNVDEINYNILNPSLFKLTKYDLYDQKVPLYATFFSPFAELFRPNWKITDRSYIVYDEEDVVHMRYHHIPGEKISMPPFWPTLNDVDSLRRLEENVELLAFQYGHPLLHATVGSDQKPSEQPEIDNITARIEGLESNGFLATDHRVAIKMIGAESAALRLEAYLTYFFRRTLTGLWLSEVSVGIGDTANRGTANTLDKLSQEKVVELQNIFAEHMKGILIELLLEAGADISWILKPENTPSWIFNPVDIEGLIQKEAHVLTMWQANMLTSDEMRRLLGKEPLSKSELKQTYTYLHSIPLKEAGPEPAVAPATSSAKVTQTTLRPKNQNGQKTGPSQAKNDNVIDIT